MPPCAAIECARRGESWKLKHLTLYPSSPSVAAADPPARPEPTTRIVYFRLFAGLTSLRLKRWRSHRVSIGPVGDFEFSSMRRSSKRRLLNTDERGYPLRFESASLGAHRRLDDLSAFFNNPLPQVPGQDRDRNRDVADRDQDRDHRRGRLDLRRVPRMEQA